MIGLQGQSDDALLPPPALTLPLKRFTFESRIVSMYYCSLFRLTPGAFRFLIFFDGSTDLFYTAPIRAQIGIAHS